MVQLSFTLPQAGHLKVKTCLDEAGIKCINDRVQVGLVTQDSAASWPVVPWCRFTTAIQRKLPL